MKINREWKDFEILATGDGEKLERWGDTVLLRPDPQVIIEGAEGMSSAELRDYVVRGRAFRAWRESRMDDADAEAEDDETRSIDGVVSTFELDDAAEKCVLGLSKRTHLTGRGIVRLVRIARTIADVAESERVTQDHVLEAAMYQGRRDQ